MSDETVKVILENKFKFVLIGKLINFIKKNIFRSLIASLLFSIVKPELFGGFWKTFLLLFFGLIILDLITIFIIAKIQSKKRKTTAYIFSEKEVSFEKRETKEYMILNWDDFGKAKEDERVIIMKHKKYMALNMS